jgi:hypothetical protein
MALFRKKEKVEKVVKKPALVEIYKWQDGTVEVYNGGTIPTIVDEEGDFPFMGKECEVTILDEGSVPDEKWQTGVKQVLVVDDKSVNALEVIDGDRVDKLSDEEKEKLEWITYKEIHATVVNALESGAEWTPFIDACQDADQKFGLPKSHYAIVKVYENRPGRTVVGFDVRLFVGGNDVSDTVQTALWDNGDIGVDEGDPIGEVRYCASDDPRVSAKVYRFSVPQSLFQ